MIPVPCRGHGLEYTLKGLATAVARVTAPLRSDVGNDASGPLGHDDRGERAARRRALWGGRDLPSQFREFADEPVRFQRILEPGLSPPGIQTFFDDGKINLLSVKIKQRQLAARLGQAPPQVKQLAYRWKITPQRIVVK